MRSFSSMNNLIQMICTVVPAALMMGTSESLPSAQRAGQIVLPAGTETAEHSPFRMVVLNNGDGGKRLRPKPKALARQGLRRWIATSGGFNRHAMRRAPIASHPSKILAD